MKITSLLVMLQVTDSGTVKIIIGDVKFKISDKTNYKEEVKYNRKINLIKEDNNVSEEEYRNYSDNEENEVFQDVENEEILQKKKKTLKIRG